LVGERAGTPVTRVKSRTREGIRCASVLLGVMKRDTPHTHTFTHTLLIRAEELVLGGSLGACNAAPAASHAPVGQ
jgi:hypothetical protein